MKQIQIENLQRRVPFPRALSGAMRACALHAIGVCGLPEDSEVAISIVSPRAIREVNRDFRRIDAVTDVLSFPAIDWPAGVRADVLALPFAPERNPETGRVMLGDLLICIVRAKEQAEAYGHGLLRELCFLTVHGMLHLAGYDHINTDEEKEMNALTEKILSEMHVPRV